MSVLGALGSACTVEGEDVMTTFSDLTMNPSGNPATSDDGDTEPSEDTGADTGDTGSDDVATTSPMTTDPGESGATGDPPVDEQPDSGMYSECATVGDCIGQTTCVIVAGAATGYCSSTCSDPLADCDPNPGATSNAAPVCVDDGGIQVCALGCQGGLTCPGGMECLSHGGTQVCV